jgi:hypothetical protein
LIQINRESRQPSMASLGRLPSAASIPSRLGLTAAPNTASMLVPVVGVGVRRIATVYRHEDAFVHWKTSWNRV